MLHTSVILSFLSADKKKNPDFTASVFKKKKKNLNHKPKVGESLKGVIGGCTHSLLQRATVTVNPSPLHHLAVRCFRPRATCIDRSSVSAACFYNCVSLFAPVTPWNQNTANTEIPANDQFFHGRGRGSGVLRSASNWSHQ